MVSCRPSERNLGAEEEGVFGIAILAGGRAPGEARALVVEHLLDVAVERPVEARRPGEGLVHGLGGVDEAGVDCFPTELAAIDARPDLPGNQAFIWIGNADFSTPGQLRYAYAGGNTIVSGNLDSDQQAEFQIVLTGHFTLIAGDFVL